MYEIYQHPLSAVSQGFYYFKNSILLISYLFANIFQKICLSKKFFVILHSQILYK